MGAVNVLGRERDDDARTSWFLQGFEIPLAHFLIRNRRVDDERSTSQIIAYVVFRPARFFQLQRFGIKSTRRLVVFGDQKNGGQRFEQVKTPWFS